MMKIAGGSTFITAAAAAVTQLLLFETTTVKPTDAFGFTSCTNRSTRQQHHHQQLQQRISVFDDNNNALWSKTTNDEQYSEDDDDFDDDEFNNDDEFNVDNDFDTLGQQNRRWLMETYKLTGEQFDSKLEQYRFNDTPTSTLRNRANWIQQRFDLTDKEMNRIIQKDPKILSFIETNLGPTSDFLEKLLGKKSLKATVLKYPRVMTRSQEKIICLKASLKLDEKSFKKLIMTNPTLLSPKIEVTEFKLELIKRRLKTVDETKLRRIIIGSTLSLSIETINAKFDWLQHRLSLDDDQVSRVVQKLSSFFSYSIRNKMEPNLQWLEKRLSLADNKQLSSIITRQPQLLYLDKDSNLGPTLDFYADAFGSEDDAIAFVRRNPVSFTRSLEKCLRPRLAEAREAGLDIDPACIGRIVFSTKEGWDRDLDKRRHK